MKQTVFATMASSVLAVDTATLSALMQAAPFARRGLNSNTASDTDIKRQNPNFANPRFQNMMREPDVHEELSLEERRIPKSVRNMQAAIKDPYLGHKPELYPAWEGADFYVPVDRAQKRFISPVFIVDPEFNGDTPKEVFGDLFRNHDHGGWRQPLVQSHYPIICSAAQHFFHVSGTCECMREHVAFKHPRYEPMNFPQGVAPVYEPQYENADYVMPRERWHTMYRGDDYGGHNIPFPHPRPPTPAPEYEHAFVDLGAMHGMKTPFGAHYGGIWDYAFNGLGKAIAGVKNNDWGQKTAPYGNQWNGDNSANQWGNEAWGNDAYGQDTSDNYGAWGSANDYSP